MYDTIKRKVAQRLWKEHFLEICPHIPPDLKSKLEAVKNDKKRARSGAREYWAKSLGALGVYEETTANGTILRFRQT